MKRGVDITMRTPSGDLTRYALSCGYVQVDPHDENRRLLMRHGVIFVFDPHCALTGYRQIAFKRITDARRYLKARSAVRRAAIVMVARQRAGLFVDA